MERAYYIVESGEIRDAIIAQDAKMVSQRQAQADIVKELSKEIGCRTDKWLVNREVCVGILFENKPPMDICGWKRLDQGAWWPKKNTPNGKRIAARFNGFKRMTHVDVLPSLPVFDWKLAAGRAYYPGASYFGGKVIVTVPYDEMKGDGPELPEDISKHFVRIKAWEFNKMVEEWEESVKVKVMVEG